MKRRLLILFNFLMLGSTIATANPCDMKSVPEQIQSSLNTTYAGWKVVLPSSLETSDRGTWLETYSKECPGMIKGKFTSEDDGYVLNLIQKEGEKTFQQVVYFQPTDGGFTSLVIFPRTAIKIVTVIRKFAPGRYKAANGGKSLLIKTDTIGISQIDAWTEVYYWEGTRFRRIVTSE